MSSAMSCTRIDSNNYTNPDIFMIYRAQDCVRMAKNSVAKGFD